MYTVDQVQRVVERICGEPEEPIYQGDIGFIISVAECELGVTITDMQADVLWREYSDWFAASWLVVGRDRGAVARILRIVLDSYLREESE